MRKLLTFLVALLATTAWAATVTDLLTGTNVGDSGSTSYTEWSNLSFTSAAVYAGQSAYYSTPAGGEAIQIRSKNSNTGIVTTASGGKIVSITVVWHPDTYQNRVLNIYGKNTAYSAATDLYDTSEQGTKLGTLTRTQEQDNTETATFTVSGDYAYIGLRSNDGAQYFTSISIVWETGSGTQTTVETPTFSPAAGTYTSAQNVTISCGTSGATIHYTTNGDTPTSSSATYSSAITVSATTTIKAIAVMSGMTDSEVATATYTISSGSGGDSNTYEKVTSISSSDVGKKFIVVYETTPAVMGSISTYGQSVTGSSNFTKDGTTITLTSNSAVAPLTLGGSSGEWTFALENGSYMAWTSGNSLTTRSSVNANAQWNITFSNGVPTIANVYSSERKLQYNSASTGLRFACYSTSQQSVALYRQTSSSTPTEQVATPTFSPAAGTYTSAQNVTISCTTSGATIHYTLDGTTPTSSSSTYSGVISVSATTTIKAIAVKEGYDDSEVATATYTINLPQVATPTFSPAAGTYTSAQNVTISCTTSGATIYYTTNGDDPTTSSSVYSTAITVSETTTVKAIAVKDGMTNSEVASATYTINAPQVATPVISPGDGTVITGPTSVSISCATDGATIHYTTDGTTPTSSSATYSTAFTISATTTVKAIAVKSGMTDSEVASATITYQAPATNDEYTLVTDASTLASGDIVIIVSNGAGEVMTAGLSGSSSTLAGSSTDVTISSDKSTVTLGDNAEAVVLVLEGSSGAWTFRSGTNYMVASSSSNSVTMTTNSATHTIVIGSDATATIKSGTGSRFLQYNYNNGSTRFGTYASSFAGDNKEVQIYRQAAAASSVTTVTGIAAFKTVTAGQTVRLYLPDSYNARVLHATQTASNATAGTYTYDAYVRDNSGAMLIKGLVTTREMAHDQHIAGWLMGQYTTATDGNPQLTPALCQSTDRTHCPWFVIADPVSETATEPVAVADTEVAAHAADWVKVSNVKVGTTSLTLTNAFNASYNVYNGALVDVSAIATPTAVYPVALGDEPVITHVVDATQAFVSPSSSISDVEVRLAKPFTAGVWTPLTVPFDITEFDGVIMKYIGVQQGEPVTASVSGRQVDAGNMIFGQATSIQAGVPYLVKAHDTTSGMTFSGVTLSNKPADSVTHTVTESSTTYNAPRRVSSTDEYTMTGTYSPTSVSTADNSVKVMKADGSVGWASALGGSVDGSSAYFTTPADQALRIVFDGDSSGTITGINDILAEGDTVAVPGTYNLMGVRMTGDWQSLPAGIYIVNGKKTVKQ